ncbi:DUF4229 domain-containing protein [Rhodoglobus aureus]|uniref:DUF4229 domain-containing protein n=1 Tax=Rhodoglobus aureus TaxID=191497 RepID=A0ABP4GD25_9MICO
MKPWILYSVLRLGIFAAVFALLMVAQVDWWLSAIIAAIVGFAISYIFFDKLRDAVALDIVVRRSGPSHDPDRDAEDAGADLSAESRDLEDDR